MDSLLNRERPTVFCPGCAHDRVIKALDKSFQQLALPANRIVMVSDIGCSGLFDTFFNTHAFHGLHGRALTYATGIKLARPDLKVVVTMGDGGLGIGGAHLLAACRRNLDLTLLVLNNFNFGMTGGQCSATTPNEASVGSGFLNKLDMPMDVGRLTAAAGAPFVQRCSSYQKDLPRVIEQALAFDGFSVLDVWGVCPGRYTRKNRLSPKAIDEALQAMPAAEGPVAANQREEYGRRYRSEAAAGPEGPEVRPVTPTCKPPTDRQQEIVLLGSAGQRIVTAGELLCLAGLSAGLRAAQKNDYPITVLRGHSVSEVILSPRAVGYTGIRTPSVVLALAPEGVARRKALFGTLDGNARVIAAADVALPETAAHIVTMDFRALKIKPQDRALAALAALAVESDAVSPAMLSAALDLRFKGPLREEAGRLVDRVTAAMKNTAA